MAADQTEEWISGRNGCHLSLELGIEIKEQESEVAPVSTPQPPEDLRSPTRFTGSEFTFFSNSSLDSAPRSSSISDTNNRTDTIECAPIAYQQFNNFCDNADDGWTISQDSDVTNSATKSHKSKKIRSSSKKINSISPVPDKPQCELKILGGKYILMGPLDPTTTFAVHKDTRKYYHIKRVTSRAAWDVVNQHGLLEDYCGVRSPEEVVTSDCGDSWLVFPPHHGDLHSYVRRKRRLREADAQRLFSKLVTIVDRCHEAGLVLRDLKLRKFVFSDPNREEIILESLEDSVYVGNSDVLHDKHGCPAYVAPEILTSSYFSGKLADMWGLGVILYTMLVGRYPFHNADTAALFAKIRQGKYSIPDWVSTRARHLILSLLRRMPVRRLTTKQVLSHPWLMRPPRDHVIKESQDHCVPMKSSFLLR